MDLSGEDVAFIHQNDLVMRNVGSSQQLSEHLGTTSGDSYSLSNYSFLIAEPDQDGYAPRGARQKVAEIMQSDPAVLADPLKEKIRNAVDKAMNFYNGNVNQMADTHFLIMRQPGSSFSSYAAGGYRETLGKHGGGEIRPDMIETVINFNQDDLDKLRRTPDIHRSDAAVDIMTDKVVSSLSDLSSGKIPASEKGAAAVQKALGSKGAAGPASPTAPAQSAFLRTAAPAKNAGQTAVRKPSAAVHKL